MEDLRMIEQDFYSVIDTVKHASVLLVEDDGSQEVLWQHILSRVGLKGHFDWVENEYEAEELIRRSIHDRHPYDLVVSDIYLPDQFNGIDLWLKFHSELHGRMILTSSINVFEFTYLFPKNQPLPLYLQKPLNIEDCIEAVHGVLKYRIPSIVSRR